MKRLLLAGLLAAGTMSGLQACPQADTIYRSDQAVLTDNLGGPVYTDMPVSEELITAQLEGYLEPSSIGLVDLTTAQSGPGTAMRLVGRITGDTNRRSNRKLHIRSNGYGWTINAPDNVLSVGLRGERLSVHDLHEGDWVVAEGTQIGNSRIRALAIRKLGDDEAGYRQSNFFMPSMTGGYAVSITTGPDFRMQAQESILGVRSQVAGERQEIYGAPRR
ncbi:MAG: hypothetical protein K0Q72_5338 [Armatimonadetes bacterium]|nr:hypothetical protein [Armatimonadota bacterium]